MEQQQHTNTHPPTRMHTHTAFPFSPKAVIVWTYQCCDCFLSLIHLHTIFWLIVWHSGEKMSSPVPRVKDGFKVLGLSDWMSPSAATRGRHLLQYSQVVLGRFSFFSFWSYIYLFYCLHIHHMVDPSLINGRSLWNTLFSFVQSCPLLVFILLIWAYQ